MNWYNVLGEEMRKKDAKVSVDLCKAKLHTFKMDMNFEKEVYF